MGKGCSFKRMIKKVFAKKVTLWQKGGKGASQAAIWRRRFAGISNSVSEKGNGLSHLGALGMDNSLGIL